MLSLISAAYLALAARAATPPPVALSSTIEDSLMPASRIISRAGGPVTCSLVKTMRVSLGTELNDILRKLFRVEKAGVDHATVKDLDEQVLYICLNSGSEN